MQWLHVLNTLPPMQQSSLNKLDRELWDIPGNSYGSDVADALFVEVASTEAVMGSTYFWLLSEARLRVCHIDNELHSTQYDLLFSTPSRK
jgi:hypothetical protein